MNEYMLVIFSITAGFTGSAIIANLYRVLGMKAQSPSGRTLRSIILIFAGPSVLFETAMRGFREKTWHPVSFWLVSALVAYWSLSLGLLVLEVATHLGT